MFGLLRRSSEEALVPKAVNGPTLSLRPLRRRWRIALLSLLSHVTKCLIQSAFARETARKYALEQLRTGNLLHLHMKQYRIAHWTRNLWNPVVTAPKSCMMLRIR